MRRFAALTLLLVLLLAVPAAAQDGNPFDDNLPSPSPTVTAAPNAGGDDTSPATVYVIAGGALVLFLGIGFFITRDARRNLTAEDRAALDRGETAVPAGDDERLAGGKRGWQKAKARKKGKAQRNARKANRPR